MDVFGIAERMAELVPVEFKEEDKLSHATQGKVALVDQLIAVDMYFRLGYAVQSLAGNYPDVINDFDNLADSLIPLFPGVKVDALTERVGDRLQKRPHLKHLISRPVGGSFKSIYKTKERICRRILG